MFVKYLTVFAFLISGFGVAKAINNSGKARFAGVTATSCNENPSGLVEYFFNVIFQEFRESPPLCICVNMCLNQPTYCFPNGCLKSLEYQGKTKQATDTTKPPKHKKFERKRNPFYEKPSPMKFLAKEEMDEPAVIYEEEPVKNIPRQHNDQDVKPQKNEYRPNLFRDNKEFKKYKKTPSVEFSYNLQERSRNMIVDRLRLERLDVSKHRFLYKLNKQLNIEQRNKSDEKSAIFDQRDDKKSYKRSPTQTAVEKDPERSCDKFSAENLNFSVDKILDKLSYTDDEDLNKDSYELVHSFKDDNKTGDAESLVKNETVPTKNQNNTTNYAKLTDEVDHKFKNKTKREDNSRKRSIKNDIDSKDDTKDATTLKSIQIRKSENIYMRKGRQKIQINRPHRKTVSSS